MEVPTHSLAAKGAVHSEPVLKKEQADNGCSHKGFINVLWSKRLDVRTERSHYSA